MAVEGGQVLASGGLETLQLAGGWDCYPPCLFTLVLALILSAAATLSCSYSGFSSPRVEWKFAHGGDSQLVCFNNKITASYASRVAFSLNGITFHSVEKKDTGMYTCMVSEDGGNNYGEVNIQLVVLVPPSKPTVSIPSSPTIGNRAVLTCSESNGSPASEYSWFKDGVLMPTDPKSSRAFINSSYVLNQKSGELVFDPVSASDSGEYVCEAQNGYGAPVKSEAVRMTAAELNVGGIVAAVLVTLILLGVLIFGIWFAYSRGYLDTVPEQGVESGEQMADGAVGDEVNSSVFLTPGSDPGVFLPGLLWNTSKLTLL
ncbi:Junctional adhesion molecule A [Tupaia chinensis]|uniref:Junctional adhesion molecule A n=1 Tax=Tupaia chinensis TaxID=246437 RepID=L8YDU8_TUPCH|nr:Junctional adhesion molecule A [Tupaia chinensis]